jgi:hypothetical protein
MYNNKEFDLDEAREYIKGFYYKDLSPEKEEELVKTLEANRKKFNRQNNRQSRRQQNANSGHQQTGQIDMEDFKTANEMEVDTDNNFNADDFDTGNQGSGGTLDFDTDDEGDKEAIWDGFFHESEHRSAPSFDIRIDGITELSDEQ